MYRTAVLDNGIRVVHKFVDSDVGHCGLIINTGTRDESNSQHGIAHLTEHMLFKGTKKRRAFHVLSRMEDVGGEIDAYTTKEETCITASFLHEFYERAIELINDVIFNSVFLAKEIEKEKEVIIDEINSYKDSPADMIFDDFEDLIYPKHSLGRNILGTKKSLKGLQDSDIKNFISEKYNTDQMVFCSIGNIKFEKLLQYCNKYFGNNPANKRAYYRQVFSNHVVENKIVKFNTHQAHCVLGTYAYTFNDPKRLPLFLISNLLAGPGMNSRLNMALRERKGISYNIEANYSPYEDTGNFNIYFGSDKENIEYATELIFKELNLLKDKKLGPVQLNKAKKQLIGQIAIGSEIHSNMLLSLGKSFMIYNQVETLKQTINEIETVTSEQIQDVANELFIRDKFSSLIYF
ncbi:MAG: pitrilysin family protein [Bacteroidales bacterium]|nr:pitrilysin family protein [Bacteroidales bacterium]